MVYEPDERCGLERRPWKGGPISEEELVKGEETLRLHSEDTKCVEDWIRKWGEKIHRGEDIPRDAYRCSENSAELEKLPPALMSCEESQIKSLVDLTINGSKIVQDKGVDILITWNKTAAELVITVRNEKTKKEEEHRFRFNMRPRYAIVSTDKRIISTNKNYVELVIFDGKTQLRLGLDKSCRPIYEIYEPTY